MKKQKLFLKVAASALLLSTCAFMSAQVTVGSDKTSEIFSVLELVSNHHNGMRLPQMTTEQRDIMADADFKANPLSQGLQIFNMETRCVETWSGFAWITACAPPDCSSTVFPALNASYDFAAGATVADLIDAIGGDVQLYNAATGGAQYNLSDPLNTALTYYAEQKIGDCTNPNRVPVAVTISTAPVSGTCKIDACVTGMYDFQYQTLTAYGTTGGAATQWQWYVKRRGDTEYKLIPNATAVSYTIPANFVRDVFRTMYSGTDNNDGVVFKVEVWNALNTPDTRISTTATTELDIEFIDTYGNDYAELNANYDKAGNPATGIGLKIAYLNLGQDRDQDGTQNACDFGDLYQWGRWRDGHENITWTKDINRNIVFDDATKVNQILNNLTSSGYDNNTPALEGGNQFYQVTAAGYTGKFLINNRPFGGTWTPNDPYQYLWALQASGAKTKASNDPCPSGWRVPTRFELGALFKGTPDTGDPRTVVTPENTWTWRTNIDDSRVAGGMIVTYGNGSDKSRRIFMPATGMRSNDGTLYNGAKLGYCWSSTYGMDTITYPNGAYNLSFSFSNVNAAYGVSDNVYGFSVRCVKE